VVKNKLRLPGQFFDEETGLYYNWHRYYSPETGRYVSADPIGLGGGINFFAYVSNDPINWVDSDGLWPEKIHNRIINKAFPTLPKSFREALERGSKYADTFQSAKDSYIHAMRNRDANQSKDDACKEMNEYIKLHMDYYRNHLKNGRFENAFFELGMALHPIMDSTAPPHQGFQEWGDLIHIPISTLINHRNGESSINDRQMSQTIEEMRRFLNN
jgi:RHS repeat-associated protein